MINVNCNLCGQDEWDVRFRSTLNSDTRLAVDAVRCTYTGYGHHAQIVQCRSCGHVYANPRWSAQEIIAAYQNVEDPVYAHERAGRELTFRKHLDALENRLGQANNRSVLDVGAYIGVFVEVALASGWDARGLEPSEWAVTAARERGLPVQAGTLADMASEQQFDVVTMWDVIEHMYAPSEELGKAFDVLKPGGTIVVHTMDIDSLTARLMGKRWPWLMDMHVQYFSQKTLARMLENNGFEVVWSGAQGRYLRLGYLASRLGGLNKTLGQSAESLIQTLRMDEIAVPVNFGDLFTVYARRP
ncbi:MAG: methyltransferase domain-containing protein [Chloroflexi bacterium]|jgi:2-polyprenyl-3-methyl-5-hydroxy-6-metoxy-1,4-benzoquinol methylase|nr:methyltransferase domain-containing protein [Chloroflexota bacterium]